MSTQARGSGPGYFRLIAAAAAVAAAAIHAGALNNGFTFDDPYIVVESPLVTEGSLWKAVSSHYWAGSETTGNLWRPLPVATYWLSWRLFGPGPFSFHLVNLLLHAMTCLLVAALALRLCSRAEGGGPAAALASALLFAAHPVHTEAVVSVVGRAELLATLMVLAAWLWRHRPWPAAGLFGLALLSKENAIVLPALLAVEDFFARGPAGRPRLAEALRWARLHAPFFAVAAIWALLRLMVVVDPETVEGPFLGAPAAHRVLTAVSVLGRYLWLMIVPLNLSADYSYDQIPRVTSIADAGFLAGLLVTLSGAALALGCRRRLPAFAAGLCVFFVALLPVSNLPFGIGVIMAERLLYLPSFGLCLAAGVALAAGLRALSALKEASERRLALAALSVVLVPCAAFGARSAARTADWYDQLTLFEATARTSPRSALAQVNLGSVYQALGRTAEAEQAYRRSIVIAPDRPGPHYNLATLLEAQGRSDEAIAAYQEAVRIDPGDVRALNNLGRALVGAGRSTEAIPWLETAARINPSSPTPSVNLAAALLHAGDLRRAEAVIRRVLAAHPSDAAANRVMEGIRARSTGGSAP